MKNFKRLIATMLVFVMVTATGCVVASAQEYVTLYNEAGESIVVKSQDSLTYQSQGWYTMPVVRLYTIYGDTIIVYAYEAQNYINIGWSADLSAVQTTMYDVSGNSIQVFNAHVPSYEAAGWSKVNPYAKAVTNYYNSDIPDYSSVTGAYLFDYEAADDGGTYAYTYTYEGYVAYTQYLSSNGWVYDGDNYFDDGTPYYVYRKGNARVAFSIEFSVNQVWVFIYDEYKYVNSNTNWTTTSTYSYYPGSYNIPTYTSVTGVSVYDTYKTDEGAIYKYLVGKDDNAPVEYLKVLNSLGWSLYESVDEDEVTTKYYFAKDNNLMSVVLSVDYNVVSVTLTIVYLY